jgi:hypothetical protein
VRLVLGDKNRQDSKARGFRLRSGKVELESVPMIFPRIYPFLGFLGACFLVALSAEAPSAGSGTLVLDRVWTGKLSAGAEALWKTAALDPSRLYILSVSIEAVSLRPDDSVSLSFEGAQLQLKKRLYAGDPSCFTTFRPRDIGPAVLRLIPSFSQGPAPAMRRRGSPPTTSPGCCRVPMRRVVSRVRRIASTAACARPARPPRACR